MVDEQLPEQTPLEAEKRSKTPRGGKLQRPRPKPPGKLKRADVIALRRENELMDYACRLVEDVTLNPKLLTDWPTPPARPPVQGTMDDPHKKYFLHLLLLTNSIQDACGICGFTTQTVMNWRKQDGEFEEAIAVVLDSVRGFRRLRTRQALEQRGILGFNRKPVLDKEGDPVTDPVTGDYVYQVTYSDAALSKLAEMDFPELREKQGPLVEVHATGVVRVGAPAPTESEYAEKYGELKAPTIEEAEEKFGDGSAQ